jgi:hypothetical protein
MLHVSALSQAIIRHVIKKSYKRGYEKINKGPKEDMTR